MTYFKQMICAICLGIVVSSMGTQPSALISTETAFPLGQIANASTITPRKEQTEWRNRLVDGKLQKRLWSITYKKWLTEWEWVK